MKTTAMLAASAAAAVVRATGASDATEFKCARPNASFCVAGDIVLRCDGAGIGVPRRCAANVAGYPPLGGTAECWESRPGAGDAACQKNCVVYAQPSSFTLPAGQYTPSFTAPAGRPTPRSNLVSNPGSGETGVMTIPEGTGRLGETGVMTILEGTGRPTESDILSIPESTSSVGTATPAPTSGSASSPPSSSSAPPPPGSASPSSPAGGPSSSSGGPSSPVVTAGASACRAVGVLAAAAAAAAACLV